MKFGGREYPACHGMFKLIDHDAFAPVIEDAQNVREWLTQYASYMKGGSQVFSQVFGPRALAFCKDKKEEDVRLPNGKLIPADINCYNCEPDVTELYPGDSDKFTFRMAKLRLIIEAFAPAPIGGEVPGWGKKSKKGGIKNDVNLNEDAAPPNADGKREALIEKG